MNEFESLLEELDDLIEDAWRVPLSNGKIVIEREELARIVGGLHTHYPTEIARAKNLLDEREKILLKARTDSERMIKNAEMQSNKMLNEQDIIKESRRIADEIRKSAEEESTRMRRSAVELADMVLKRAEDHYDQNLALIKQARRVVKNNQ